MKQKTTKEIIGESFLELAQKEKINKITITDITDNCQLSQPTFYNHFKDKADLIEWLYSQNAQEILGKIDEDYSWKDSLRETIKEVRKKKAITLNTVESSTWQRNFFTLLTDTNTKLLIKEIRSKSQEDPVTEVLQGIVEVFCYGTTQYILNWLKQDCPIPEEEVYKIIIGSVPEAIQKYLF